MYREKKIQSIDNCVNVENRFPIFSKYVEAYISLQINIRMIYLHLMQKANENHFLWCMSEYIRVGKKEKQLYLGLALDFWWFMWID